MLREEIKYFKINNKHVRGKFIFNPAAVNGDYIVFLHDGLGCIESFGDFPERLILATSNNGFIYDRINFGKSDSNGFLISPDYMHRQACDYLPELLTEAGIYNPGLYGYSDGATIALIYAGTYPTNLRFTIAEAVHVLFEQQAAQGIRDFLTKQGNSLAHKLELFHEDRAQNVIDYWSGNWLNPEFEGFNIYPLIKQIRCPVLAFQGTDDEYATDIHLNIIRENAAGYVETFLVEGGKHNMRDFRNKIILRNCTNFINSKV